MREHLTALAEYAKRVFVRIDFVCGGVLAIGYYYAASWFGWGQQHPELLAVGIAVLAFAWSSYAVYYEERRMRFEREREVRLTAKIGSYAANLPDPGKDKTNLRVRVFWEAWVARDIDTDRLALNLIYLYDRPWWQFWKKKSFPQTGIPPGGHDKTTQYRKKISAAAPQPFRDDAEFEYVAPRDAAGDPHWLMELVLVTGSPKGRYTAPVFVDWDEMHSRGSNPPL